MLNVRPATGEDVHYLLDIDVKCFDYPWSAEHWRVVGSTVNIAVATYYGTPIGMVVFAGAESEKGVPFVTMVKLAVKESFRNRGIGETLLLTVVEFGRKIESTGVRAVVPESSNAIDWLIKMGFKASGVDRECFDLYGIKEDGYMFQRELTTCE